MVFSNLIFDYISFYEVCTFLIRCPSSLLFFHFLRAVISISQIKDCISFSFKFFISCYCRSMEQINCEETRQEALDLKCQQILPGVEKSDALSPSPVKTSGIVGNLNSETEIASLTPQKTSEPLHANFKEKEINLPDKWVSLQMHMFCIF